MVEAGDPMDPNALPPPSLPDPTPRPPALPAQPPQFREKPKPSATINPVVTKSDDVSWAGILRDALTYPGRRDGWIIIGGVVLLCTIPILGWVLMVVCFGLTVPYYLSVVETTVAGRDDPPDWPEMSNFYDSIVVPFVTVNAVLLFSRLPALAYSHGIPEESQSSLIVFTLESFGILYFPMALLGLVVTGSLRAAAPDKVLSAIHRSMPAYALVVILGLLISFSGNLITLAPSFLPIIGTPISLGLGLYFAIAQARLLGLFHRRYEDQIDLFGSMRSNKSDEQHEEP